ncbi:hypothetical protein AVT25_gp29 [Bacillus phage Pavlov]|uniref:hypothetical protein n=1 Tax=Bacillus phage Pavlov TaxID=1675598 RepID=UPI00065F4A67|nr:hypothetical protein AVT25_gp29 [Bacillus phage Pavlov]AKQ07450.1 hypothetical protein CPT_Pavlov29 [Bacillus phage Pavlov]
MKAKSLIQEIFLQIQTWRSMNRGKLGNVYLGENEMNALTNSIEFRLENQALTTNDKPLKIFGFDVIPVKESNFLEVGGKK